MLRAKHIAHAYGVFASTDHEFLDQALILSVSVGLTEDDVKLCTPKFWSVHVDPITCLDGAATTLMTIQLNLAAGTIARNVDEQPHHLDLLQKMLRFDVSGQFCLTELDHGLDALNIETTATMLPGGGFELCTPHPGAAKFMPPTYPCGIPCFAVVFARLVSLQGRFYGIKPFVVQLSDGASMMPGITCRQVTMPRLSYDPSLLPPRRSASHIRHSLTYFNGVRLSGDAILGSTDPSYDHRLEFLQSIWRVAAGSLGLGSIAIPALQIAAFIAGRYSQRRTVHSTTHRGFNGLNMRVPLISFKTQQAPILIALCQSFVLQEFWKVATALFSDECEDPRVRHGVAAAFKAIGVQHSQAAHLALSERCGAQGLFNYNQICTQHAEMRGIAIAEGDILGLSIRLASELVLGRYELPPPVQPDSLLVSHESGLLSRCRRILERIGDHRSEEYSRQLIPRAEKIVQSIGHRMAYDAAISAPVPLDKRITDLYLWSTVRLDEAWYSENTGISAEDQFAKEDEALLAALPMLDKWLEDVGVEEYVSAPIVSKERWEGFVTGLECVGGLQGVTELRHDSKTEARLLARL
ncbi:acyl-CoA dehydrogenase NM domain-like protein [Pleurotus eryngii]|uniref:Acyl-CoA dehydrogenase NM domain-like protein n=1 Tax=Pleurotus eryngii TaxID=5323 RepID=A0A9P6DL31_PLEER|nr:acyl-CoA dehydrogenase NM domain-like protein [Pleurotus eryngii]